jgi:hypothetical protein
VLKSMKPNELADAILLRDVLAGYLPMVWVEALLPLAGKGASGAAPLELDVRALLARYEPKGPEAATLERWKREGRTDLLDELVARLAGILGGPECGVLAANKELSLGALEALFSDLPGDHRERLQDALGGNATACVLLDVRPEEVVTNYGVGSAIKRVEAWKASPGKHHRVALLTTAVRAHVLQPHVAAELRKSNTQRLSLGHFLLQIGERWGFPLAEALQKVGVTPIRP